MGWIQKLYETYEQCAGAAHFAKNPLPPISHVTQQAHIEIVIDGLGNFSRASILAKEETLVPATEKSAGRTSGEAAHPLCDKIQYCAADYPLYGGKKPSYFRGYREQLKQWCDSEYSHPKARAVLAYVIKGAVVSDLIREKILQLDEAGKVLLTNPPPDAADAGLFKQLTPKKEGAISIRDQGDAFIRWRVEIAGNTSTDCWDDPSLNNAWINYYASRQTKQGICMVTGENAFLAEQHPARIRNGADKAKLISSNDTSGYTFRGRFLDSNETATVGFEVTQKAHNALRWLVDPKRKQAYWSGDQVIVSWAVSGKSIPDPFANTTSLFGAGTTEETQIDQYYGDSGQAFGNRLSKRIAGYRINLESTEDIVVMGLDSATPGRMAITFYRELKGSEFLDRVQAWHGQFAWLQNFGKDAHFVGAPAPRDIAEAAYGRRLDDKLRKSVVERLLPCIIDAQPLPRDLLQSTVRRTCNRVGLEPWEWEKCLGIACSLFRGYSLSQAQPTEYSMALEPDRTTRDYLYGRLLAIAENIEHFALTKAEKNRDTAAAKLIQRFSERPFSTWKNIELALTPYKSRLRSSDKGAGFLFKREKLLDDILCAFHSDDFTDDTRLTAEFLLGYHCQRHKLWEKAEMHLEDETSDKS